MSIAADICRKITALNPAQIDILDRADRVLALAADLAHAQVTLYATARNANYLAIVSQARPNTSFLQFKSNIIGNTVQAAEEPLVCRVLESGESIAGQREWALGMDVLEMRLFPLRDGQGKVFAVVSFETSNEEYGVGDHGLLVETAYLLLLSQPPDGEAGTLYRPLGARDGIVLIDERGYILLANPAADSIYKVLGVNRLVGRRIYDRAVNMRLAQRAVNYGQPDEAEMEIGSLILVQRAIPVNVAGWSQRTLLIVADVTEVRKKEKELLVKSAVIQEIHHRVKNNLQTIASLLRLQARRTRSEEVKAALRESVNRILSISVVHEFLSQQDREFIDVAEVAKNILDMVIQNMLEPDFNIETVFNGPTVILPSEQASSLALVINELIQNCIEHGFVGRQEGLIGIDIEIMADEYQIDIFDNGIGLPESFDLNSTNSLGLQIVRTLIETDLGGKFRLSTKSGTRASITVPRSIGDRK
ncbi:MAG TPA: histidine kinase N-terminal domain-containing protein [Patescibacteria group bacterium]|nr:histidine kinase N-terminal domain-containing protein [Patescibacteria group bacterium]